MFARAERFSRAVQEETFPIGIFLLQHGNILHPSPTAGLVNIPRKFNHGDVSELAIFYKACGFMIVCSTPALGTNLHDSF
jgi:hypothetical protein